MKAVVGLAFNEARTEVLLIRKNRPSWQTGFLNGVGGKIEVGEEPVDAMRREFFEETGYQHDEWEEIVRLTDKDVIINCFRACLKDFSAPMTNTDEEIVRIDILRVYEEKIMHNLKWLIPMAVFDTPRFPVEYPISGLPSDYRWK